MDIVVKGRHIELSERFREHVAGKLGKVERLDGKCQRIDVVVSKETNPRLAERAIRVELTCRAKGPVVRAEAAASEKYAALDAAYAKLEEQLRRAADRRRDRHRRAPARTPGEPAAAGPAPVGEAAEPSVTSVAIDAPRPPVVREKVHDAAPMTLDQALEAMELVGHDFYLFSDAASGLPSVVYRRKGYDYGVIQLRLVAGSGEQGDEAGGEPVERAV